MVSSDVTRARIRKHSPTAITISRMYRWSWRAESTVSLGLDELLPQLPGLIESGGVGLVWPRIRGTIDAGNAIALALNDGYRAQAEHNIVIEQGIGSAVRRLRDVGIEPVLVKGWAISRLYPHGVLRPAGDIDLWVPPEMVEPARSALRPDGAEPIRVAIDLQYQPHLFSWLAESGVDLQRDTEVLVADGVEVRVPRQDDHLRMVCLHFLGHGALRPLWLCDIALLMESRGPGFDWNRVLGNDRRQREWVITSLLLAHELLGARIDDTPIAGRAGTLPAWLAPAVTRRWEAGGRVPHDAIAQIASGRRGLLTALTERWPDPITATVRTHAPFNAFPRFPLQCAAWLIRVTQFAIWRMPGQVHDYYLRSKRFLGARSNQKASSIGH